jgi:hypothetical protein
MKQLNKRNDRKIHLFLKAVPYLKKIGKKTVLLLAKRFNTSPQRIQKLIDKVTEGGGCYDF